ncbi:lipopolysaccharide biosynthesis protein [Citrobacter portucalensis]|uniref:lipopolysaccharide biosynthesis protein n=1 Tax=Citrobacter portucalensis TaxID=1639133 RepID=UPI00254B13E0|nr:oligosaccharide flippase family protein [Citrobacter portucalensis]EIP1107601.1 oligosaccharide flippase family protein [Citrobacter freundii]WOR31695.1 hypothetical protein R2X24_08790 [Citrobacter portucalensis]
MKGKIYKYGSILSGNSFIAISNILISIIMARYYGLEYLGEFTLVQTVYIILGVLSKPFTWQSIIKFSKNTNLKFNIMRSMIIELCYLLFFVFFLILLHELNFEVIDKITYISLFYNNFPTLLILIIGAWSFNIGTVLGYFRFKQDYVYISLIQTLSSFIKVLICLVGNYSVAEFIIIYAMIDIIFWLSAYTWIFLKSFSWRLFFNSFKTIKKFTIFSIWGQIHSLLDMPVQYGDRFIINLFLGTNVLGAFNIIRRIGMVLGQFTEPLYQIIMVEFKKHSHLPLFQLWKKNLKSQFTIMGMGCFLFIISVMTYPFFDRVIFHGQLRYYEAVFNIYLVIQIIVLSFVWLHPIFILKSKMKANFYILLIANATYLLIFSYFAPLFDLYSFCIAYGVQTIIVIVSKMIIIKMDDGKQMATNE